MSEPLTEIELIALEEADRGCVSGTLDEWPVLLAALRRYGWQIDNPSRVTADGSRFLASCTLGAMRRSAKMDAHKRGNAMISYCIFRYRPNGVDYCGDVLAACTEDAEMTARLMYACDFSSGEWLSALSAEMAAEVFS